MTEIVSAAVESLVQVRPQILHVLDTRREPDQVVLDAQLGSHLGALSGNTQRTVPAGRESRSRFDYGWFAADLFVQQVCLFFGAW